MNRLRWLPLVALASCAAPATDPVEPAAPPPPPLSSVLTREPRSDNLCSPPFSTHWTWDQNAPDASREALDSVIWLTPPNDSDVPVVDPAHPRAHLARCFAAGPHRDLNLRNWCCRE
jgi:hypothetical protein